MILKNSILWLMFLFFFACTKTEYVYEKPDNLLKDTIPPDRFEMSVSEITDRSAFVEWKSTQDPGGKPVHFEIALNDSIIGYNLETLYYPLQNLNSNTAYSVSVIAFDTQRNSTKITVKFTTMKVFLENTLTFSKGFKFLSVEKAMETLDNGVLIGGRITETFYSEPFLSYIMKFNSNYQPEWLKIYPEFKDIKDILEVRSGGYLVLFDTFASRIDQYSNEQWTYKISNQSVSKEFSCVTEDKSGNFIISGINGFGYDLNYTLEKCSPQGKEISFKISKAPQKYHPADILIDENENIVVFGIAREEHYWIAWSDKEMNLLNQFFFPNNNNSPDMAYQLVPTVDHNYLLVGDALTSLSNFNSRFLKIKPDGQLLWEKYYYLNSTGVFPHITFFRAVTENSNLILTSDDRGSAISEFNNSGELIKHLKLTGYPSLVFIRPDRSGKYVCFTKNGQILIMNPEGYTKP